ncbi:uncharacterized protein METZ01_LOCUS499878, partial [marine metagenome]
MNIRDEFLLQQTRRSFLAQGGLGLGAVALDSLLLGGEGGRGEIGGLNELPHFKAKARRVIYLFQSGGPAQMDLFDYKPKLASKFGQEVPKSIYPDARKTTMTSGQKSFPVAPSILKFSRH